MPNVTHAASIASIAAYLRAKYLLSDGAILDRRVPSGVDLSALRDAIDVTELGVEVIGTATYETWPPSGDLEDPPEIRIVIARSEYDADAYATNAGDPYRRAKKTHEAIVEEFYRTGKRITERDLT
jgi:hypothetical protein